MSKGMGLAPFAAGKTDKELWSLNGDQITWSNDTSQFRQGSAAFIPTNSPLGTLIGGQIAMYYKCHNVSIDERGVFAGRDDPGGCGLVVYCEDDTVRYFGAPVGAKGTLPVWTLYTTVNFLTGAWTYVGPITPSASAGIVGTIAVGNANAGSVGEYISATVASGAAIALTTATVANVTSISLSAGDWDVDGVVDYTTAATTNITQLQHGSSTTTAALGAQDTFVSEGFAAMVPGAILLAYGIPTTRINVSTTTTVFLVAKATFTVSTLAAYGTLRARRVR